MSTAAAPGACTAVPAPDVASTHQLTNAGTDRLAFKVESSNNAEYHIKPAFGFVETGAALEITGTAEASKEDVVNFTVVPANAADPKTAFEDVKPARSEKRTAAGQEGERGGKKGGLIWTRRKD